MVKDMCILSHCKANKRGSQFTQRSVQPAASKRLAIVITDLTHIASKTLSQHWGAMKKKDAVWKRQGLAYRHSTRCIGASMISGVKGSPGVVFLSRYC